MIDSLITLFKRDLTALKKEINLYNNEENLWNVEGDVSNCAGNLCLHIVGNLNHFVGSQLGNTGYVRKRDLEFSLKNVPVDELNKQVDDTIAMIESSLVKLNQEDLQQSYPLEVFGYAMTNEYFLLHLGMHLAYHLGQVNYHRRLLDNT
ncbi:MAG: DinB family protein [Bacteroidia bacterium]|nr:DinB family protein [Bacteroidia bacterium]MBT8310264.1 DinB family protein [Bacteroidia bacterium]NND11024.1 DinB family protein [Flavobacteriaceae bacterium]NNK29130.1 DinB family protein [Flavobacteriaceae bacterium]NNL61323.1 DinB family protein [Flavobacteriaceae bacterium]